MDSSAARDPDDRRSGDEPRKHRFTDEQVQMLQRVLANLDDEKFEILARVIERERAQQHAEEQRDRHWTMFLEAAVRSAGAAAAVGALGLLLGAIGWALKAKVIAALEALLGYLRSA